MPEAVKAFLLLGGYYAGFAAMLGQLARRWQVSHAVLRKLYHMSCGISIFILLFAFPSWQSAALGITALLLTGYLLLLIGGQIPMASAHIDRGRGIVEIREHLLLMLLSILLLLTGLWGWQGDAARYAVAVGFMAWGFGDASASLVGERWARRRFRMAVFDRNKSPLGSSAMALTVTVTTFGILVAMTPLPWFWALACALPIAVASAAIEAATRRGLDTLTVPPLAGFLSYPLVDSVLQRIGAAG